MKKIILSIIAVIGVMLNTFADGESTSCKIPGTNDYVEVTAYADENGNGSYIISNGSSRPLVSLRVTITAEVSDVYNWGAQWTTRTIYSQNYTEVVPPYQSVSVPFTFKAPRIKKSNGGGIGALTITIGNPSCN